jgi:hypothetical protein
LRHYSPPRVFGTVYTNVGDAFSSELNLPYTPLALASSVIGDWIGSNALYRFVAYGLSIAAAFALGTCLVLLRGIVSENQTNPTPRVPERFSAGIEMPLAISTSVSQIVLISPDASVIEDLASTAPLIAQAVPVEQHSLVVDSLIEKLHRADSQSLIAAHEPALNMTGRTAQLSELSGIPAFLIGSSADVVPLAQLAARAPDPAKVELDRKSPHYEDSTTQAEDLPSNDTSSGPVAWDDTLLGTKITVYESKGEILVELPPDVGLLRHITGRATVSNSNVATIDGAKAGLGDASRIPPRSHTDRAKVLDRHTRFQAVARVADERAFVSAASKPPAAEPRPPRRIQQSPRIAFVTLPSEPARGMRSGNGGGGRAMFKEQITRIELPHALRPLP